MDVATLKAKIKSKRLPSYLIFSGEEWKVQEIYIKQIAKAIEKEIIRIDSVMEEISKLKNKSFLKKPVIYIVRDDKELMQDVKLQDAIDNGTLGQNILIHLLTSVDKRTKYYKRYKDSIVEFEALSDSMLKKYIKKEIDLSDEDCQILVDICEHDYGRCLLEIDKIKWYQKYTEESDWDGTWKVTVHDCFRRLIQDGTIYEPPYDAIFDLVDTILDRHVNKAFNLLKQSYDSGEATMVILSVLYNNAKAVLQIQSYDGDNLSKATGLTGWQIKNAKAHVKKYTNRELVEMLRLIQKVESGIKTGTMEDEFAMQYLLVHIM